MENSSLLYAKKHKKEFLMATLSKTGNPRRKSAIFMAGTPGAGKSEMAKTLSLIFGPSFALIDADRFRESFPEYNGKNSSDFQSGAAWLVDYIFTDIVHKGYSFILDGTFAHKKSEQNIERVLNRGYGVKIYFVQQDPLSAWKFTKIREKEQGRVVPKRIFIESYIRSRDNVATVKKRFKKDIVVNIAFKDFTNTVTDFVSDADEIDSILPAKPTKQEIEVLINEGKRKSTCYRSKIQS